MATPLQNADKVLDFLRTLLYSELMLKKAEVSQEEMEFVTIGSLVPDDHLLRKIDRAVDFEFIRERVRHLYCENNGSSGAGPGGAVQGFCSSDTCSVFAANAS